MHSLSIEELGLITGGMDEADKDYIAGVVCAGGIILGSIVSGGLLAGILISVGIHSCAYGIMKNIYI